MIFEYASPIGILEISITDNKTEYISLCEKEVTSRNPLLDEWFDTFFQGKDPGKFPYELSDKGSDFEKKVRTELLKIPFGKIITYGELARRISDRMSAQAVGQALNKNPFLLAVPCHRVIGKDGNLTGFAIGNKRKKILLENEGHTFTENKLTE